MTNYIDLALKYGGFTSLDKVYLENVLAPLSDAQKLTFITPPPSVINAYFAEIYQKQGAEAATDYFLDLSKALNLFNDQPTFDEHHPFIRLNLTGKSFGFAFENAKEEARVFAELDEKITPAVLFELAQVFPQYKIYQDNRGIKMSRIDMDEKNAKDITPETSLLSHVSQLKGGIIKISSFNQDELLDLASHYKGQKYFASQGREAILYIKN